jgi:photosystem II stability/assembly factor-like uncharacterized protein
MVRMQFPVALLSVIIACGSAQAQWQIQNSHTTASLRGIHALSSEVAWASGTNGTVLHTTDGGTTWLPCTTPPNAEKLDFRGIQAFDAQTAIVMSSGKGDLSRLYKTTDACKSWKLLRTNADKDGFWDALVFKNRDAGELVGDPVKGHFVVFSHMGSNWFEECNDPFAPSSRTQESAFAASNSSVLSFGRRDFMLGTGGVHGSRVIFFHEKLAPGSKDDLIFVQDTRDVPITSGSESAGIFALSMKSREHVIAVGGDYQKPNDPTGTAAFTMNGGKTWQAAETPPHGYRSAVAYDEKSNTWITVGPNGTDISTDDGKNWHAPQPAPGKTDDSAKNWNALSLPFVVGPNGRIGKLDPKVLAP